MADTKVRTYDPKKIIVVFGPVIMTGFAEGTVVSIAQNGDNFEKVKGADGGVDRVNKNANDHAITVTLKQTSISNDALSVIAIADAAANAGIYPLTIKDLNGTSLFFAEQAWIAKSPDDEFGDAMSNREWRLDTGIAEKFTGGNL